MREIHTIDAYVAAVAAALGDIAADDRATTIEDLEAHLRVEAERVGEQAAIEALGPPQAYADAVRAALAGEPADETAPQGRVLGMPYDFRGVSVERLAQRLWNPADPRVFMPRLLGVGWTVNFGAIAVKLGLLRPDDTDDAAFERVPDRAVVAVAAVPALLALATVALIAIAWPSLPARVPFHWGPDGSPDGWAPKTLAFGLVVGLTVLPVALTYAQVFLRRTSKRARIVSAAALGLVAALGLGLTSVTVADADGGRSGHWVLGVIVAGLVLSFVLLYVPLRLGLRAEWREAARLTEEGGDDGPGSAR